MKSKSKDVSSQRPKNKKTGCLTTFIVFIVLFFIGISKLSSDDDSDLAKITISADTETVYDINTSIPVTVDYEPSGADLDNVICKSSGGDFSHSDNSYFFTANEAGNYTISVSCDDIESNSLVFEIEDKAAIAAEESENQDESVMTEEASEIPSEQTSAEGENNTQPEQAVSEEENQVQTDVQAQEPQEQMVWISETGTKYHSNPSCSNMNNPQQVTLTEAQNMGLEPCKKCY